MGRLLIIFVKISLPLIITSVLYIIFIFLISKVEILFLVIIILFILFGLLLFLINYFAQYNPIDINDLPMTLEAYALLFYTLFIGCLVNAYSEFFMQKFFPSIMWGLASLSFLFISYRPYFTNKNNQEISQDLVMSFSGSMSMATIYNIVNNGFSLNMQLIWTSIFTFLTLLAVYIVVRVNKNRPIPVENPAEN